MPPISNLPAQGVSSLPFVSGCAVVSLPSGWRWQCFGVVVGSLAGPAAAAFHPHVPALHLRVLFATLH